MTPNTATSTQPAPDKLLRDRDVAEQLGVNRTTVWDMAAGVENFPKPIKLSAKITRWRQSEVQAFIRNLSSTA